MTPGAQLFRPDGWLRTLGYFVRKSSSLKGILTIHHVADPLGSKLYFPNENGIVLATGRRTFELINDEIRFPGTVDEPCSDYRVDCAFVELDSAVKLDDLDAKIPILDDQDNIVLKELGNPTPLDLESLVPFGKSVLGVVGRRSFQRGTDAGFAYSSSVYSSEGYAPLKSYTDLLIVGEDNDQFSAPGASGKLIVIDDKDLRPIGLLWGGWKERLRQSRMQEDWTYAIDINNVLKLLKVTIAKRI